MGEIVEGICVGFGVLLGGMFAGREENGVMVKLGFGVGWDAVEKCFDGGGAFRGIMRAMEEGVGEGLRVVTGTHAARWGRDKGAGVEEVVVSVGEKSFEDYALVFVRDAMKGEREKVRVVFDEVHLVDIEEFFEGAVASDGDGIRAKEFADGASVGGRR